MSSSTRRRDRRTPSTWVSCWRKCSKLTSKATGKLRREVLFLNLIAAVYCAKQFQWFPPLVSKNLPAKTLRVFSTWPMMHLCTAAPDVAALALSGDWAAEFLSGPESTSAPGLASLSDAADADWTREFISEAAGSPRWIWLCVCERSLWYAHWQCAFLLLCPRSWTLGWGVFGAVGGEAVAGRSWRQGERMVRTRGLKALKQGR